MTSVIKHFICLLISTGLCIALTAQNNNINPSSKAYEMPEYKQAKKHLDNRRYAEAEELIVTVLSKLQKANKTKDYVEMLNLHAKSIMHQWRTEESMEVFKKMKSLAKENNFNLLHSDAIQALSVIYVFQDSFKLAEDLVREGVKLKGLPPNDYSNFYLELGEAWLRKNNIDSALYYSNKAYEIDIEINDSISLPKTCQSISKIYSSDNNYNQALAYLIEGKSYIKDDSNYKHAYFNSDIALAMLSIRNIEKAQFYAEEAVRISRLNNLTLALSNHLSLLASIEEMQGNYGQALSHYKEASKLNEKPKKLNAQIRISSGIIASKLYLGQNVSNKEIDELLSLRQKTTNEISKNRIDLLHLRYLTNNGIKESQYKLKNDLLFKMFKENNNLYDLRNLSKLSYDYYTQLGNYRQANVALESYMSYKDTIFSEIQEYKILELEAKYDKAQDEKKIDQLALTNTLQANTLKQQTIFLISAALVLTIILVLSFLLYKYYRKAIGQNKIVNKALEEKDFLLREIHHRVKNNLQVVSSLLSLQARQIGDKDIRKAIHEGRSRVRSMALIHQNLYQNENLTSVSVNRYLSKLLKELFDTYNVDPERIKLDLQLEDINLDVDTMVPFGLILNELVSNCLKHAFPDQNSGTITIKLKDENNQLLLSVKDDGVGVDQETMSESKSFGNRLITAFSKKMHADIEIINKEGTTVNLTIKNFKKAS